MRTVRTERTHPPQLDTPSCPSTTAGCSTLGATSSTRMAGVCPPSPGDHSQPANTQHHACHITSHTQRHGLLVVAFPTPCVQTTCTGFFYVLFVLRTLYSFSLTLSLLLLSCLVLLLCVSRAMFPETEEQEVSQMMATESNYYPTAVLHAW